MHIALAGALIALTLAQTEPAPPIQAGRDSSWTMALAGDVMLCRGVKKFIAKSDHGYPFAKTCSLTVRADLAIANLESPLTTAGYRTPSPWRFTGDTLDAARALSQAGFDLLALANNHMADCGRAGLLETGRWLDSAGIAHAGNTNADTALFDSLKTADSLAAASYPGTLACLPAYRTVKGIKVGFLSFCEPYLLAIARDYGAELVARADSATVARSILAARDSCDLLVCSFHWGEEYRDHPTKTQKKLGRLAIDLGARVVHGHHPHVLEGGVLQTGTDRVFPRQLHLRPAPREAAPERAADGRLQGRGGRLSLSAPLGDRGQPASTGDQGRVESDHQAADQAMQETWHGSRGQGQPVMFETDDHGHEEAPLKRGFFSVCGYDWVTSRGVRSSASGRWSRPATTAKERTCTVQERITNTRPS
jgi:hypothetical protein